METNQPDIPSFEELAADPAIAPLLDFEPVPRKVKRPDGWTPELQRELIARLAATGTLQQAVWQMGKHATGAEGLYKVPTAHQFRASWDAALALGRARNGLDSAPPYHGEVPGITRRTRRSAAVGRGDEEWEEEEVSEERGEEARDSISNKLQRVRRLYLAEICNSAGKRAAFEILAGFPVDWEKAKRGEPQDDEPYRPLSIRTPDLILMGEAGYLGFMAHGRDRLAELRRELDEWRAEQGLPAIDWSESTESSE